ncbi:glycosyltransferase family 8 protein [Tabrizicola aquatica]|uniref:glycosyltransferase family 8 protein n=1 Tax=Tabrizicola aquatica TaxID=909926 RepID=UPI000CD08F82|nr:glycosyltransferase [Tabrizicola aquatica]
MPDPQRHDTAVAFCCDSNYFHLALFTIWQLVHHNPQRRFDFVISTQDDLVVPDWARSLDVVLHRAGTLPEATEVARYIGSVAPLYRIMLARELQSRYRRILYLDCDMFVEGGDINRLLEVDLGPHPLGAVLDAPFMYERNHLAREFLKLGLPAAPYANTGMQVIDTRAYCEQDLEKRSFDVCKTHPQAIFFTEQSLTNLALRGKFAQLAPCWNWQNNARLPLINQNYPVFLRHFIGRQKPDRFAGRMLDARFNMAYREFLSHFAPDVLSKVPVAGQSDPLTLRELGKLALEHLLARRVAAELLARYPDPYKALL